MSGEIIKAARWLSASIILSSVLIVVGLRWGQSVEPIALTPVPASTADPEVTRTTAEVAPTSRPGVEGCHSNPVPVVDAAPDGSPASCLDPPSEVEIWDKVGKSSTPFSGVRFAIEKIGEKVDPCKVYPLAGACQLVHCHYKCTVYFDETYASADPIPINHRKSRVEVVFIDKDHLRRCDGSVASSIAQP